MNRTLRRVGAVITALWLAVGPALAPRPGAGAIVHTAGAAHAAAATRGVGSIGRVGTAYDADGVYGVDAVATPCPPVAALSTGDTPDIGAQPDSPAYLLAEPTGSRLLTALDPTRGPHPGASWCMDGPAADRPGATSAAESRIRAIQQNALAYLADHAAMRAGLHSARGTAPAPPLG